MNHPPIVELVLVVLTACAGPSAQVRATPDDEHQEPVEVEPQPEPEPDGQHASAPPEPADPTPGSWPAALPLSVSAPLSICGFEVPCRTRRRRADPEQAIEIQAAVHDDDTTYAFVSPARQMHPAHNVPNPSWRFLIAPGIHDAHALDAAIAHTGYRTNRGMMVPERVPPRAPITGLTQQLIELTGVGTAQALVDQAGRVHVLISRAPGSIGPPLRAAGAQQYAYYDGQWHPPIITAHVEAFGLSSSGQPWFMFANGNIQMPDGSVRSFPDETNFDPGSTVAYGRSVPASTTVTSAVGLFSDAAARVLASINGRLILIDVDSATMRARTLATDRGYSYDGPLRPQRGGRLGSRRNIPLRETYVPVSLTATTEGLVAVYARSRNRGRVLCDDQACAVQPGRICVQDRSCWMEQTNNHYLALLAQLVGASPSAETVLIREERASRMQAEFEPGGQLRVRLSPDFNMRRATVVRLRR